MASISEALTIAIEHHQAGRLEVAAEIYQRILTVEPDQVDALHLRGVVAQQMGNSELAVAHIRRAIELKGTEAGFHSNLGEAYRSLRRLPEAIACYRRALELKPDLAEGHFNLGNALTEQGELDEAVACHQRALQLKPGHAGSYYGLGIIHGRRGRLDEAIACYRRAVELKPDFADALNNLGNALRDQRKTDEAVACFRRAVKIAPGFAAAYNNLGNALQGQGRLDEAAAAFHQALELKPDYAKAHNNLGNLYKDQGKLEEALACYRRAVELQPDYVDAHSNAVSMLYFVPGYDSQRILSEHVQWNRQHAEPLAKWMRPHSHDRSPDRRLRIGYVSPDFCSHSVGRFLLPLLQAHDHLRFEIVCYASVHVPDTITDYCRSEADVWRDVVGLTDDQLAEAIRQDQIDILVDLTMHLRHNRLLVFARKPAPVQVAYLAYCGTTGLGTMDYRLTDPYLDPPGQNDGDYCEESIRLPETYWCYQPLLELPSARPLPAIEAGHVTFGCLNNFCKVSEPTRAAWVRLLRSMPSARLMIHAHSGSHRNDLLELLARQGVSPERVSFIDYQRARDYFRIYERIDVALDPFPYGGGTTTCDAVWMGVPVVSLAGQTAVGRAGMSILSNLGLRELVASTPDQYIQIARDLAGDLPRLKQLRATLRERMRSSPLTDAPRFARNVEAAYRAMWQRWCREGGPMR